MQPGDSIVALAGQPVGNAAAVEQVMSQLKPQHPVPVRIYCSGQRLSFCWIHEERHLLPSPTIMALAVVREAKEKSDV